MKNYQLTGLVLLGTLVLGCRLLRPEPPAGAAAKAVDQIRFTVLTEEYAQPIAGVTVACAGRQCSTDAKGSCTIAVPTQYIGNSATWIRIERTDWSLSREFRLPLRRQMILTYPLTVGEQRTIAPLVASRQRALDSLTTQIDAADRELTSLTAEITQYVSRNGPSAVKTYATLVAQKRALARRLRGELTDLRDRYRRTLAAVSPGEIIDLLTEEEAFRTLRSRLRTFRNAVGDLSAAAENMVDADPNFRLRYFFRTGEYRTYSDPEAMREDLRAFLQQITAYRQSQYAYLADHELRYVVQAAGYTDGQPIDPTGTVGRTIGPLCRQYGYTEFADYNYCLGYLRAREILDDLRQLADLNRYRLLVESFGPELATGPEDNPSIRTCILSFNIYPLALEGDPGE